MGEPVKLQPPLGPGTGFLQRSDRRLDSPASP